ncbi:MAG: SOS response-associated peptidase [Planctomycetota bacterium]
MCGRFSQNFQAPDLAAFFEALGVPDQWESHFNLAPTQSVAVVRAKPPAPPAAATPTPTPGNSTATVTPAAAAAARRRPENSAGGDPLPRELAFVHWGLIPAWAQDRAIASKLFNARSETAAQKPSFRDAFAHRRCIVPANCFYEWRRQRGPHDEKQPLLICRRDRRPLALAGLWERWQAPEGVQVESCSILTTAANRYLKPIHDRMPVILEAADFSRWIDPTTPLPAIQALCTPCPDTTLTAFPVAMRVNSVRNDDASLLESTGDESTWQNAPTQTPDAPSPHPQTARPGRRRASPDDPTGQGRLF